MIIKLQYTIIGLLASVAVVLSVRIWSLNHVPEPGIFNLRLNAINSGIQKMSSKCHQRYNMLKEDWSRSENPKVIHAIKIGDQLMSFEDSAKFYFNKLSSFKNDRDSAQHYFFKYGLLSRRFSSIIQDTVHLPIENYVLKIEEKLPGKELPFDSPEGVEILALLLEAEFYETMEAALSKIVN